jgi:hypothetical protein
MMDAVDWCGFVGKQIAVGKTGFQGKAECPRMFGID